MSANIQQARDVLAGTRNLSSFGSDEYEYRFEKVGADGTGILWRRLTDVEADPEPELVAKNVSEPDARLFFMLGSPELLSAMDGLLDSGFRHARNNVWSGSVPHAQRIAAAIIAADERMTS